MGRRPKDLLPAGFVERWKTLSIAAETKRHIEALAPRLGMSQNELVAYAIRVVARMDERRRSRAAQRGG